MRLIDADKLITEIKREFCEGCNDDICDLCWVTEYIELLKNAPTVDAEHIKHGHWISHRQGEYICSNCNSAYYDLRLNYCGSCGAKMDKKSEDTE